MSVTDPEKIVEEHLEKYGKVKWKYFLRNRDLFRWAYGESRIKDLPKVGSEYFLSYALLDIIQQYPCRQITITRKIILKQTSQVIQYLLSQQYTLPKKFFEQDGVMNAVAEKFTFRAISDNQVLISLAILNVASQLNLKSLCFFLEEVDIPVLYEGKKINPFFIELLLSGGNIEIIEWLFENHCNELFSSVGNNVGMVPIQVLKFLDGKKIRYRWTRMDHRVLHRDSLDYYLENRPRAKIVGLLEYLIRNCSLEMCIEYSKNDIILDRHLLHACSRSDGIEFVRWLLSNGARFSDRQYLLEAALSGFSSDDLNWMIVTAKCPRNVDISRMSNDLILKSTAMRGVKYLIDNSMIKNDDPAIFEKIFKKFGDSEIKILELHDSGYIFSARVIKKAKKIGVPYHLIRKMIHI